MKKEQIEYVQERILEWYRLKKRRMPWRDDPTPYHVWISEIMLQQTRVEAVREYYSRFISRLPDVESLARVEDDELYKLWEGLGYYNRAKNLKKTALILTNDLNGRLPSSYEELIKLPGIGPYTAGAIASIAYSQRVPAVDGNVMRVITRMTGDYRDISQAAIRKDMERIVGELLPEADVQSFNQALMELGALVCVPNGFPKCEECPVSGICYAFQNGAQTKLPVKKMKKDRKKEKRTILIFMNENGEFLIQKRNSEGLLPGLWEFASISGSFSKEEVKALLSRHQISYNQIFKIEESKHVFSHIEWLMKGYFVEVSDPQKNGIICCINREADASLPTKGDYNSCSSPETPSISEFVAEKREDNKGVSITENKQVGIEFTEEQVWSKLEDLKKIYSIPTAFKCFVKSIETGMIGKFMEENGL